jgi:arabinogalactan oligomer / maltooligosaccharide transport system substrate-binding protein
MGRLSVDCLIVPAVATRMPVVLVFFERLFQQGRQLGRIIWAMKEQLVLVIACLALLLSACAVPPSPPTATPAPAAVAPTATGVPPTPRPTARPPTPAPSATPVPEPLRIWIAEEGTALVAVQGVVERFAQAEGQPIRVLAVPPAALRTSLISGELINRPPPDLLWADQDDLAELLAEDLLLPVDGWVNTEDFLPATLQGAEAGGKLWGVPVLAQGGLLLYYNRALLPNPPRTTDELIVAARATGNSENFGLLMPWGQPRWLLALLQGFGGAPTDPAGEVLTLDTPEMVQALNLLVTLRDTLVDDPPQYGRSQRIFGQGYAAMLVDGQWAAETLRTYSETLDLGVTALPNTPASGRPTLGYLGGSYLMAYRELPPERRELAEKLARLLAEPQTQQELASATVRLPASKAGLTTPALAADPVLAALAMHAAQARGLPPTRTMRCALAAIEERLGWLFAGDLDAGETAAAMQRDAEACAD